jgi:hypothetical protein
MQRFGRLGVVALLLAIGCGPVPGGSLRGTQAAAPADWAPLLDDGRAFCEIESRPADPHSIQLECFLFDRGLHVQSHRWALARWWPAESWAEIWLAEPDVRVRLGDQLYELRALQVSEPERRAAILRFRGYDSPPEGIVVFRFEPRG